MHKASKRITALVMSACLLIALAFGGVMAWGVDSGQGGPNSLTAKATDNAEDDIASANATYSVYKIGDATKDASYETYGYTLAAPYDALPSSEDFGDLTALSGSGWQALANEAAEVVTDASLVAEDVPVGEAVEGLNNGLYLIVAANAYTETYEYSFNPTVVALPTKEPLTDDAGNVITDEDGYPIIKTSVEYGEWLADATVVLKSQADLLPGSLKIIKNLESTTGKKATFVFRITGEQPNGQTYDNVVSITLDGDETQGEVELHGIPVGTTLDVTEEYDGAAYELVSSDGADKVIVADHTVELGLGEEATATFTNKPDESLKEGYGIENVFTLADDGDWDWIPRDSAEDTNYEAAE